MTGDNTGGSAGSSENSGYSPESYEDLMDELSEERLPRRTVPQMVRIWTRELFHRFLTIPLLVLDIIVDELRKPPDECEHPAYFTETLRLVPLALLLTGAYLLVNMVPPPEHMIAETVEWTHWLFYISVVLKELAGYWGGMLMDLFEFLRRFF